MRKVWGCDEPQQIAVETLPDDNNEPINYHSCPLLFIPKSVQEFYRRYESIKSGMSRPVEYEEEMAWFNTSIGYYEHWLHHFKSLKGNRGGF